MKDEGRTYKGREAIREWKRKTSARYGVKVQALSATSQGEGLAIVVKDSDNFPGSPANLTYDVALNGEGPIRSLSIP